MSDNNKEIKNENLEEVQGGKKITRLKVCPQCLNMIPLTATKCPKCDAEL